MNVKTLLIAAALGATALAPLASMAETLKAKTESTADGAGGKLSDAALTTRIKAKLVAEDNLSALDIHVDSTSGVVTLSGDVDNEAQVDLAERVVEGIDGVKAVHNRLDVKQAGKG
jgi:hyperosmotically inducible protein